MRNTFFLLLFLISGICFSQNPDRFRDGIRTKLVQPDTLSTMDRDNLTPKLGTILYHKDTGVSRWEKWDGTDWVEFGGDTSGFVTLYTDQTITGLKTFDNNVIIEDNLYIGNSSAIAGSKLHVNKVSSDGSTSVSSFINNENTLSGSTSNITFGTINRTFFSGSGTTGEIWGTQSIGRNSGSGTSGTLIGSNSLAELSGSGTSSNLYGSFSNTKINGSGSSTTTTALGGWDRVEINNPLSSVDNIYGTYSNVDLIGGTVTNQAVANFLDFDFVTGDAADVSVNNLYYIKANADNLPTVTGEAYFIKSEVDLPSSFAGSVTAPEFISSVSTGTAPLTVASTTKVDNLNADLLDGINGATYARIDQDNNFTSAQTISAGASGTPAIYLYADSGNTNAPRIRYTGSQSFRIRDDTAGADRLTISSTGGVSVNNFTTTNQGNNAALLTFNTERPWLFKQTLTGASSQLSLVENNAVGSKLFTIGDLTTANKISFSSTNGNIVSIGTVTATSFIKSGGTSTQYLMADGSTKDEPYLKYVALLTQSGTSAPTATVLENTLGGAVTTGRTGVGTYTLTLGSAFTLNKTVCFTTMGAPITGSNTTNEIRAYRQTTNNIIIQTTQGGALIDGNLTTATIEVRVYP